MRDVPKEPLPPGLAIPAGAEADAALAALQAEHDAIDAILTALQEEVLSGADDEAIRSTLDRLMEFYAAHFAHEENFLREQGDPQADYHADEHRRILQTLRNTRALAHADAVAVATLDTVDLLHDCYEHLEKTDKPAYDRILQRWRHQGGA